MSIDPQVIRSEPHTTIGNLLQRDASIVLERWSRQAAAEQSGASAFIMKCCWTISAISFRSWATA